MKYTSLIIVTLTCLMGAGGKGKIRKEAYNWISFETVRKDAQGKLLEVPKWQGPNRLPAPVDTFAVYGGGDSIRMISADMPAGTLFTRFELHGYLWKPRPSYMDRFIFLGTYLVNRLPGLYYSYYATKDWNSLLQVEYTNPGNMNAALYFSRDSVNIFQQTGKIVDPTDELSEPERPVIGRVN